MVKLAKGIEESCVVFVDAPGLPDGSYGEAREGDWRVVLRFGRCLWSPRQAAMMKLAKETEESCVVFVDATGFPYVSDGEAREGDWRVVRRFCRCHWSPGRQLW